MGLWTGVLEQDNPSSCCPSDCQEKQIVAGKSNNAILLPARVTSGSCDTRILLPASSKICCCCLLASRFEFVARWFQDCCLLEQDLHLVASLHQLHMSRGNLLSTLTPRLQIQIQIQTQIQIQISLDFPYVWIDWSVPVTQSKAIVLSVGTNAVNTNSHLKVIHSVSRSILPSILILNQFSQ